jgi:hypothetical protein
MKPHRPTPNQLLHQPTLSIQLNWRHHHPSTSVKLKMILLRHVLLLTPLVIPSLNLLRLEEIAILLFPLFRGLHLRSWRRVQRSLLDLSSLCLGYLDDHVRLQGESQLVKCDYADSVQHCRYRKTFPAW